MNAEMRETVVISASKKSLGSMPPQSARSYWKSLETSRSRDLIEISIHQTPSHNRSAKIIHSYKSRDIFLTRAGPVKAQTAFFFQSWARQSLRNRASSWWACLSRKSPGSCRHLGNQWAISASAQLCLCMRPPKNLLIWLTYVSFQFCLTGTRNMANRSPRKHLQDVQSQNLYLLNRSKFSWSYGHLNPLWAARQFAFVKLLGVGAAPFTNPSEKVNIIPFYYFKVCTVYIN